jgi:xanthine phosphoribosyltransferase
MQLLPEQNIKGRLSACRFGLSPVVMFPAYRVMQIKPVADIISRVREIAFCEDFDTIVAIGNGGVIPAMLLQQKLDCDVEFIWLKLRDDNQNQIYDTPQLLKPLTFDPFGKSILLVDDRSASGKTLDAARGILSSAAIIRTLVVNGKADYPLFDEECFYFPWRIDVY